MNKRNADSLSGGVFLIGIGFLFLFDWFWPGILLLFGVVSLINQWAKGNLGGGITSLAIFGVLTLVFSSGLNLGWRLILPVGLIAVGLIALVNAMRGK